MEIILNPLLDQSDIGLLKNLHCELIDAQEKTQIFRTRTEMEVSVLNDTKFPTHAAKYWQAMREQNVHFQELVMLSYEYRKLEVECKKLERSILSEEDDLEKELHKIELEKNRFILSNQQRVAKARIKEILNWSEIKEREAQHMSSGELADVDNHQLISYTKRWINQSIQMGGNGSPAERNNLLGQLRSGLLLCIKKGVLQSVIDDFPGHIQEKIQQEYAGEIRNPKRLRAV